MTNTELIKTDILELLINTTKATRKPQKWSIVTHTGFDGNSYPAYQASWKNRLNFTLYKNSSDVCLEISRPNSDTVGLFIGETEPDDVIVLKLRLYYILKDRFGDLGSVTTESAISDFINENVSRLKNRPVAQLG